MVQYNNKYHIAKSYSTDCHMHILQMQNSGFNIIYSDLSFLGIVPVAIMPMNTPVSAIPTTLQIIAPLHIYTYIYNTQ